MSVLVNFVKLVHGRGKGKKIERQTAGYRPSNPLSYD